MASKLETMTQCQICLEDMADRTPRALTCLHTFCHDCLVKLPTNRRRYCSSCQYDTTDNVHVDDKIFCANCKIWRTNTTKKALCCPTCRVNTVLPPGDITGLPHNFYINNIKDAKESYEGVQKCQYCSETIAMYFCQACMFYLCENCSAKHSNVGLFKDHTMRALDTSGVCVVHSHEARYFCSKCVSRICTVCVMSDNHKEHPDAILGYSDWVTNTQNKIKEINLTLKAPYMEYKAKSEQLQQFQENASDIVAEIEEFATIMSDAIKNQAQSMKKKLLQTQAKRKPSLDVMKEFCDQYEKFAESCDTMRKGVEAVVEAETQAIQLQALVKDMPVISRELWFRFTPGAMPCLCELEEEEREIKTNKFPEVTVATSQ